MKRAILIILGLAVLAGPVLAVPTATPVPTASPTPSPSPVALIPNFQSEVDVNAFCVFTDGTSPRTFICHRTKANLAVPTGYKLYITDLLWNCQSECNADVKWTTESVVFIDSVRFGNESQGKVVQFKTPAWSPYPADVPRLHLNASSAGVVYLHGVIR